MGAHVLKDVQDFYLIHAILWYLHQDFRVLDVHNIFLYRQKIAKNDIFLSSVC